MKKPSPVNNVIVAKCCDGAFRKIQVDNDTANAKANYGVKGTVYGWYRIDDNDRAIFSIDAS